MTFEETITYFKETSFSRANETPKSEPKRDIETSIKD